MLGQNTPCTVRLDLLPTMWTHQTPSAEPGPFPQKIGTVSTALLPNVTQDAKVPTLLYPVANKSHGDLSSVCMQRSTCHTGGHGAHKHGKYDILLGAVELQLGCSTCRVLRHKDSMCCASRAERGRAALLFCLLYLKVDQARAEPSYNCARTFASKCHSQPIA